MQHAWGGSGNARKKVYILVSILDHFYKQGFSIHGGAKNSSEIEMMHLFVEGSLFAVLASFNRVAFPQNLFMSSEEGGWESGPVKLKIFSADRNAAAKFSARHMVFRTDFGSSEFSNYLLSYLWLQGVTLSPHLHTECDFRGCNLRACVFFYGVFTGDYSKSNLEGANLVGTSFHNCNFSESNLSEADMSDTKFLSCNFKEANLISAVALNSNIAECELTLEQMHGIVWTEKYFDLRNDD